MADNPHHPSGSTPEGDNTVRRTVDWKLLVAAISAGFAIISAYVAYRIDNAVSLTNLERRMSALETGHSSLTSSNEILNNSIRNLQQSFETLSNNFLPIQQSFLHLRSRVDILENSAPEIREQITALRLPVGTVIASMLSEAQFRQQNGTNWVIADGRDVSDTTYHRITGRPHVPDLRGVFLRGRNNGLTDNTRNNPDGEVELGGYQRDQFEDHTHSVRHNLARANSGQHEAGSRYPLSEMTNQFIIEIGLPNSGHHGVETRPRNITVNFFIKIN